MSLHSQNQNTFTPQQSQAHHLAFPALHLHPHNNDTFIPKQIALNPNGAKVKIGRQTNQKTVPNSLNGYFDSKVLSRAHAEVWTEDGKVTFFFPFWSVLTHCSPWCSSSPGSHSRCQVFQWYFYQWRTLVY